MLTVLASGTKRSIITVAIFAPAAAMHLAAHLPSPAPLESAAAVLGARRAFQAPLCSRVIISTDYCGVIRVFENLGYAELER